MRMIIIKFTKISCVVIIHRARGTVSASSGKIETKRKTCTNLKSAAVAQLRLVGKVHELISTHFLEAAPETVHLIDFNVSSV